MNEIEFVKKDGLWHGWSGKSKILAVIVIILAILAITQFAFNKPVLQEGPVTILAGFTQELYAEGDGNPEHPTWNMVVFPYSVLLCCEDSKVETVFESIFEDSGSVWVFTENPDDGWISWWSGREINGLTDIYAYKTYWVHVEFNCTLHISCWD